MQKLADKHLIPADNIHNLAKNKGNPPINGKFSYLASPRAGVYNLDPYSIIKIKLNYLVLRIIALNSL
jgi:hypothetical protein